MDEKAREQFLQQPRTAVLSTTSKDGRIHAIPVWFLWEDGAFKILTGRDSQKTVNIRRTGRASLCIDERERGNVAYVSVEGPCAIAEPVTHEMRLRLWRHYYGDAADKALERAGDNTAEAVCLVLTPERWIG